MYYSIRHVTRFRYSSAISENVMEVRLQPRTDATQQSISFQLTTQPTAHISFYQDYLENTIHHFNLPALHSELTITAQAVVRMLPQPEPPAALSSTAWAELRAYTASGADWEMLSPSYFVQPSALLAELAQELAIGQQADPLTALRHLNSAIHQAFTYDPESTQVDSPIAEAIRQRRGVCQDYAHIMLALARFHLRIPCRYVSGYLYHRQADSSAENATHAWLEAWLPELGWVGFDPTNDILAGERHIRVAYGCDYKDVPPTHGIFRGHTDSELSVGVQVRQVQEPTEVIEEPVIRPQLRPAVVSFAPTLADIQAAQQQQ